MAGRVFCIGNGESRKDKDLYWLRQHGKLYGCNAIYRDHPGLIDCLTSVDQGMIHEVYHSGIAQKIPCFFRNWSKTPAFSYDAIIKDGIGEDFDKVKELGGILSNKRGDSDEYVLHGANLKGIVNVLLKDGGITEKNINHAVIRVSWIKKPDYSFNLEEFCIETKENGSKKRDFGWACGPTSGYVAVRQENPCEMFLVGHDLHSHNDKINNIYKSTKHYTAKDNSPTPAINWINQWKTLFERYPDTNFYKVNEYNDKRDKVNGPIDEWKDIPNVKYIDYSTLDSMLK